jgi:hypothetical protein
MGSERNKQASNRRSVQQAGALAVLLHLAILLALGLATHLLQGSRKGASYPSTLYIETQPARPARFLIQDRPLDPQLSQASPPKSATALSDRNQSVVRETRARTNLGRLGALRDLGKRAARFSARDALRQENSRGFESRLGSSGSPSSVDDETLPMDAETLLNTRQSIYYSFYARLYQSIAPIWQGRVGESRFHKPAPGRYTTRVAVLLDREGNLKSLEILDPSRVAFLDRIVLESWNRVTRFPNPPTGLIEKDGTVRTLWSFTVEVGEGRAFQFLPPRRI